MKRFIPQVWKSSVIPFRNMNSKIVTRKCYTRPNKIDYNPLNECESNRHFYKCPDKMDYNPLNECESNRKFPELEKKEKQRDINSIALVSWSAAMFLFTLFEIYT
jgi:hypothetical protein